MVTGPCYHTSTYVDGLPPVLRRTDILFSGRPSVSGPHMLAWRGKRRSGGGRESSGIGDAAKVGREELSRAARARHLDRSNSMSPEPFRQGQSDRTLDAAGIVLDERPASRLGKPLDLSCRPVAQSPPKKHAFFADIQIRLGVGGAPGAPSAPVGSRSIPRLCAWVPCRILEPSAKPCRLTASRPLKWCFRHQVLVKRA